MGKGVLHILNEVLLLLLLFDVTTLKMARKPVKLQKDIIQQDALESGEGKQSTGENGGLKLTDNNIM